VLVALALGACRRSSTTGPMIAASENPPAAAAPLPTGTVDIPAIVAKLTPVVVNVTVESTVRVPARREWDWPFDFFFGPPGGRGPRGGEEQMFQQRAMGSGFLIDGAGHVVTNAHVVEGADVVRVKLLDEREFKATVKGRDRHLDVAVLELQGAQNLPVATLGSSDALRVGEPVIAIGNPFGLGHTVTLGIVSAKSRTIGAGPYDDFIQTDAHINPGNSGGPLFDLRGEVVGINTAITAQGSGIGFAIPIDDVKGILPQLIEKGHLDRGRLGVVVQPMDWPLSRALGLDRPRGALVASVEPGSPAEKAGLQERDVIVAVDGKSIDLLFKVRRDGQTRLAAIDVP
jgi:serine protease Do